MAPSHPRAQRPSRAAAAQPQGRGAGEKARSHGLSAASPLDCLAAEFWAEARPGSSLPSPELPEIAFAGKSNVGKSTLLNQLTQRRSLARVSKTPGCTRGVVLFTTTLRNDKRFVIADLPGYGFAERSKDERVAWQTLIEAYIARRASLRLVVVLIDGRRGASDEERQLIHWLDFINRPFVIVMTKIDKLSATERGRAEAALRRDFRRPVYPVSGLVGSGREALLEALLRALDGTDDTAQNDPAETPPREPGTAAQP